MGSQKVPEMVALHCNGRTYDNAYLITSKVGPLRLHTCSIDPAVVEAPAEGVFWTLPEFGRRIQFDVLHSCETYPLEAYFQSREQPNDTRSENRRVWWLGDDRNCSTTNYVWLGALS
jgi:hypothetical protein